jgi:hypothetical protein
MPENYISKKGFEEIVKFEELEDMYIINKIYRDIEKIEDLIIDHLKKEIAFYEDMLK